MLTVIAISFSLCSFTVREKVKSSGIVKAVDEDGTETYSEASVSSSSASKWQLTVSKVNDKNVWSYSQIRIALNGALIDVDARMINDTEYVAVRSFIETATDMKVTYYSATRTLSVDGSGLAMSLTDGSNVIYANGRTLFSMTPSVIMSNGRMYAPLRLIAKALGLDFVSDEANGVSLSGKITPLTHGSVYYDSDAVFWLSRIISAESRGEPLVGQIAVGNVVLNRVKAQEFPNTIWGVIFDRNYGIQFSPVANGTIYNEPSPTAITAAKICLEGHVITSVSLFFLNPTISTSSWITNTKTYLFTVGNHDFYR